MPIETISHVPKQATQHALFVSSAETVPPTLKPGQTSLHRQGGYTLAAKSRFGETTFLELDQPPKTEYTASHKTQPDHYAYANELDRRAAATESGWHQVPPHKQPPLSARFPKSSSHWQSEYRSTSLDATASLSARATARGVIRRHPPTQDSIFACAEDGTACRDFYGRYGSNPRDRMSPHDTKLPVFHHDLKAGTTQRSFHIPNYQGHLPANPTNPRAAQVALGEAARSLNKASMVDCYHRNIVGYTGHVPSSFKNDLGGRKPTTLTMYGSDFAPLQTV